MSSIEKVYGITKQLFELMSHPVIKDTRDDVIQRITSMLDHREELLKEVQPPFTENDKRAFEQIVAWNKVINTKFTDLKQQIQLDMVQLKRAKSSKQQYVNPYQHVSTSDGMFYDKRK
ncbi:flagellar protein FliT [uncultured Metabacillus sp.]|uniref:flagellar protein FliT n=1 Tax=uncultured Metabacillus sp. TaxID=2860135 RepID=UPI00262138E5|nr:flagellar protein FliT [uncultured Metabacillus sp.]